MKATLVYSNAPDAQRKKIIDLRLMGNDVANSAMIDSEDETYLKALIRVASKDKIQVRNASRRLQFFIIKGGAEGFLDASYKGVNAADMHEDTGVTTSGAKGTEFVFDDTCLLAVFGKQGEYVNSALLRRPLSIKNPNLWTARTAERVFYAWDKQFVSLYHNKNFDVEYYGLWVNDANGEYASGAVRIDLHKSEATNGCIFIVDAATPPMPDPNTNEAAQAAALGALSAWEPKLILDVQKLVGAKTKGEIGIMRIVRMN